MSRDLVLNLGFEKGMHTFLGTKRALFVAKLDAEGTLFCGATALYRILTYAVFQSLINITHGRRNRGGQGGPGPPPLFNDVKKIQW